MHNVKNIFLFKNQIQKGPYTESDIRRFWSYGTIGPDDHIWVQGSADYVTVKNYFAPKLQSFGDSMHSLDFQDKIGIMSAAWIF